jgi:thiamine transport system ATP-binding protein
MLEIDNLTYKYKDEKSEYRYTLKAKEGEVVAIVGNSGSGKSTLLDLIAGFVTPFSGKIMFDNLDIIKLSIQKRPLTILFQNHNLFEHLSVEKNIVLGISKTLRATEDEKKLTNEILKEVGLEGYGDKLASTLSGGEQQRVALARALIRKKPILLLDEPFSGLDINTHDAMLELVKNITIKNSLQTIMVTHDMRDCDLIADFVYRMEDYQLHKL